MSISKLFTSIFAMFAIFGTDAFAAPSIRQIGVTTSSSKQSESNVERAATPSAKPAAKPTSTASATTATSGDVARLVGVPFVSGKTSHNQKPNSKPSTASASTELISLREQLESLQNDFVALATQSYVDQQLANVRTEAAQAIVEAKNDMVTPEVLNQTVDNAVKDLASSETINEAMDAKIANLSTQVDTKLNKKIEQPQLNSAISDAVGNLASNDTIVSLTSRVDGHDTELSQTLKKNDTDSFRTELSKTELYSKVMDSNTGLTKVYEIANSAVKTGDLDTYVTTKNLASKNDITNTLGSLNFTVDQNAKQVKFTVGDDTTQHKFADIADLGGTPGCSSSVTTEPDSVNRQMKITTTNSCTNEADTKYIPYGENAKEITIEVADNAIKWKREGESSHKIVDIADLKGQDAKEIQIGVNNNKITWNRVGETPQDIVSLNDLRGQDAKEIQIGVNNNKITWNRVGETPQDIVNLNDLRGQDAKEIQIGVNNNKITWNRVGETPQDIVSLNDLRGQDAKEIQIGVNNNKITWNRVGETPQDIVSLDDLKGQNAKEIQISVQNNKITWNRVGEESHDIVSLEDLKGQDGEGLTNEDKETIAEVRTIGAYFTNGKISQSHVDGLSEALASKLTSSDLAEYAKSTDVSSNIATAKQEAIASAKSEALNAVAAEYAKSTDVSSNIATAKQEAIASAKSEALNAVAAEYAKSTDVSSNIATAKQEAINSAKSEALSAVAAEYAKSTDVSSNIATAKQEAINSAKSEALSAVAAEYAKTNEVMLKGDAVAESQLPNTVMKKTDSVAESQLPNTVMKKTDSVTESQLPNTVLKTGDLDTVISDKGLLTSETLKTDSTFQNLINVLKAAEVIEDDPEGGYKPKEKNTQM